MGLPSALLVVPEQAGVQPFRQGARDRSRCWYRWANTLMVAALLVLTSSAASAAGLPRFEPVTIAGAKMNLPRGWQRQQDEASLILTENPKDEDSPALALIAVQTARGQTPTASALADTVFAQLGLEAAGIRAERIEEKVNRGALYRLHRLEKRGRMGYLVSFTHTDRGTGAAVHMLFSAPDARFVELGGPVLPLVVYGGVDPAILSRIQSASAPAPAHRCDGAESLEVCLSEHYFANQPQTSGTQSWSDSISQRCQARLAAARTAQQMVAAQADCNREVALASQIMRMSHETSMKILYNMGSGWCYRGEAECD